MTRPKDNSEKNSQINPLAFASFVRAAMSTGKPPAPAKKAKAKAKAKKRPSKAKNRG